VNVIRYTLSFGVVQTRFPVLPIGSSKSTSPRFADGASPAEPILLVSLIDVSRAKGIEGIAGDKDLGTDEEIRMLMMPR